MKIVVTEEEARQVRIFTRTKVQAGEYELETTRYIGSGDFSEKLYVAEEKMSEAFMKACDELLKLLQAREAAGPNDTKWDVVPEQLAHLADSTCKGLLVFRLRDEDITEET